MEEKVNLPKDAFQPVSKGERLDDEKITAPSRTFLQDAWRRLKENKAAFISMWILIIVAIFAFTSPITAPHPNNSNPRLC
jgi:oligopeptide transport system permease protein